MKMFVTPVKKVHEDHPKLLWFFIVWIGIGSMVGMIFELLIGFRNGNILKIFIDFTKTGTIYIISLSLISSVCFNIFCELFYRESQDKHDANRKNWNLIILIISVLLGAINMFGYLTVYKNSIFLQIILYISSLFVYYYEICFEKLENGIVDLFADKNYSSGKENKDIENLEKRTEKINSIGDINL